MKPKTLLFVVIGFIALAILIGVGGKQFAQFAQANSDPTPAPQPTAEVAIRARGRLVPGTWADLAFEKGGRLMTWHVTEGEEVVEGQPLAQLDSARLELALEEAEAVLSAAESRLAEAEADNAYQIQEAELALVQAEARLAQGRARFPGLTGASVEVERAEKALLDAREAYRRAAETPGMFQTPGVRDHYQAKIDAAEQDLAVAQANYTQARGEQAATQQELRSLEADVEQARLHLARLEEGIDPTLEQDVTQARLQAARARRDLEAATLVAPFAGTIVERHLKAEDWAQPGVAVVTLADLNSLRVETTDLDEWGATHIEVGDPAEVAIMAFDDKSLTGHVTEIALRGTEIGGGETGYRTLIALDEPDPTLRWGMTVRITLPLEE